MQNKNKLDFTNQLNCFTSYWALGASDLNIDPNHTHSCYSVTNECMLEVCSMNKESVKSPQRLYYVTF